MSGSAYLYTAPRMADLLTVRDLKVDSSSTRAR